MIELKKINKKYKEQVVLNNCNIKLVPGNVYILKGKSGSGKTTLLNIISGLDVNYDGNVLVNDIDYKKMTTTQKDVYSNNISYLMQKNLYYKKMTIRENLLILNNDNNKINAIAEKLKIKDILDKKPTEISGGELQRASLLRMLLFEPKVLLLDEPTSNLDYENSLLFADLLKDIANDYMIIIVATHKNIFDKYANQIINIEYGNLKCIEEKLNSNSDSKEIQIKKTNFKPPVFKFALKNTYKENIILKLFSISVIVLSLVALSFYFNYREGYLKNIIKEFPYHIIDVNEEKLDEILNAYQINDKYYNYRYQEDFYNCYTLLPYNDSTLKNEGVILLGKFPEHKNEILINVQQVINLPNVNRTNYDGVIGSVIIVNDEECVVSGIKDDEGNIILGKEPEHKNEVLINTRDAERLSSANRTKYEGVIGSVLTINNKEYVISGIIGEDSEDYIKIYSDVLYSSIINDDKTVYPAIFIPYEEISDFGIKEDNKIFISIDSSSLIDLYNLTDFNMSLFHDSTQYMRYYSKLLNKVAQTESPTKAALIVAIVLIIVSFFFLLNEVGLEIYFRQREIGFLKLVHFKNNDINTIFVLEYMINFFINIIISLILYILCIIYLKTKIGFTMYLNIIYLLLIIAIFLLYSYFIMAISIRKYLKKDVVELLKT